MLAFFATFVYVALLFTFTLFGIKTGQLFEVYLISMTVSVFFAIFHLPLITFRANGEEVKLVSITLSAITTAFLVTLYIGFVFVIRLLKEVI